MFYLISVMNILFQFKHIEIILHYYYLIIIIHIFLFYSNFGVKNTPDTFWESPNNLKQNRKVKKIK